MLIEKQHHYTDRQAVKSIKMKKKLLLIYNALKDDDDKFIKKICNDQKIYIEKLYHKAQMLLWLLMLYLLLMYIVSLLNVP